MQSRWYLFVIYRQMRTLTEKGVHADGKLHLKTLLWDFFYTLDSVVGDKVLVLNFCLVLGTRLDILGNIGGKLDDGIWKRDSEKHPWKFVPKHTFPRLFLLHIFNYPSPLHSQLFFTNPSPQNHSSLQPSIHTHQLSKKK